MTKTERAERRAERERERLRMVQVNAAVKDEMVRFHNAILEGKVAILTTFSGRFVVSCVREDFWFITHPEGQSPSRWNQASWAGCNDGTWDDLLRQVGVARNPLFLPPVCTVAECEVNTEHHHPNQHGFPIRFRPSALAGWVAEQTAAFSEPVPAEPVQSKSVLRRLAIQRRG